MNDRIIVTATVNGRVKSASVDPRDTLLAMLREEHALTGAKRGCDQGVCGTCTVIVDGMQMRACLMLAATAEGVVIETVEGIHATGRAAEIARYFADAGAVQCGFCTSGMLISAELLLRDNPRPTREEIKRGLSSNICRCTGYRKIIEAVYLLGQQGDGQ